MTHVLVQITLFLAGLFVITFFVGNVVLPFMYGFPRSALWAARGWAHWQATRYYLASGLLWAILFWILAYLFYDKFSAVGDYLDAGYGWRLGQQAGLLLSVVRVILRDGRNDMRRDFDHRILAYLTPLGLQKIRSIRSAVDH